MEGFGVALLERAEGPAAGSTTPPPPRVRFAVSHAASTAVVTLHGVLDDHGGDLLAVVLRGVIDDGRFIPLGVPERVTSR